MSIDPTLLTKKLRIGMNRPSLDCLPLKVRSRIEDMWRVESVVCGHPLNVLDAERRKRLLWDSTNLGTRLVSIASSRIIDGAEQRKFQQQFDDIAMKNVVPPDEASEDTQLYVENSLSQTAADRLGFECALVFLHMALEQLPHGDDALRSDPLLHCLVRLRNLTVHLKSLDVARSDYHAALVVEDDPSVQPIRIVLRETWFITVGHQDLMQTRGPKDEPLFQWFQAICDKYPASMVIQAAVERLCAHFEKAGTCE